MQIDVLRPSELSATDLAAWRAIQAAHPAFDSPYLSPDWPLALAGADGPDAERLKVAVLRRGGEAVGFLPARVGRFIAGPAGAPLCDVQALVSAPDLAVDPRALTAALGVGRLDLFNLATPQPGFAPYVKGAAEALRIDVSAGYPAYAAERKAAGTDVLPDAAKKRRKLERDHGEVAFTALSPSREDLGALVAWKRAQYRATGQTDIFDAGWPLRLLEQLHASTDPAFGARLFTLRVGDRLAAAHLALQGGGVLHAWFIAHESDFGRYSPGMVLIDDMLRWMDGAGLRALDLGPGDYPFKARLANVRLQVGHGFVGRPSPAAAVRSAQYVVRRAAEARELGRWSQLPGKAMRRLDLMRALRG